MDFNIKSKKDGWSPCQVIISLKSRNNNLVDQSWNKNGYILHFIPAHEEKVQVTIPGLIPILRHKYSNEIMKSFTPDVEECMKTVIYIENSGEISSPMDAYITEVEASDEKFNLKKD